MVKSVGVLKAILLDACKRCMIRGVRVKFFGLFFVCNHCLCVVRIRCVSFIICMITLPFPFVSLLLYELVICICVCVWRPCCCCTCGICAVWPCPTRIACLLSSLPLLLDSFKSCLECDRVIIRPTTRRRLSATRADRDR